MRPTVLRGGVRASAEPEEVYLIPGGVVVHQEPVGVLDDLYDPLAEAPAPQVVDQPAGPDARIVEHDLARAVMRLGRIARAVFTTLVGCSWPGTFQVPSQQITIRFVMASLQDV